MVKARIAIKDMPWYRAFESKKLYDSSKESEQVTWFQYDTSKRAIRIKNQISARVKCCRENGAENAYMCFKGTDSLSVW